LVSPPNIPLVIKSQRILWAENVTAYKLSVGKYELSTWEKMILKRFSIEQSVRMWTEFIWLRVYNSGKFLLRD
jgi:hypothetical protein